MIRGMAAHTEPHGVFCKAILAKLNANAPALRAPVNANKGGKSQKTHGHTKARTCSLVAKALFRAFSDILFLSPAAPRGLSCRCC